MNKALLDPKIHITVLLVTVLSEFIGIKRVTVGPGVMLFLPMLYALVIT